MSEILNINVSAAAARITKSIEEDAARERVRRAEAMDRRWGAALKSLDETIRATHPNNTQSGQPTHLRAAAAWDSETWTNPEAAVGTEIAAEFVRIGEYQWANPLDSSRRWRAPALVPWIGRGNLIITGAPTDEEARGQLLCAIVLRSLAALPAGQLRLILLDGAGVGRAFKPLTLLDNGLRGARVLTTGEHILRRLRDLREDMARLETSVLRNDFDDISSYNSALPAAPEPYRIVVVSGFPSGFERPALAEILRIAAAGPAVGVHLLLDWRPKSKPPVQIDLSPLIRDSVVIEEDAGRFRVAAPRMPDNAMLRIDEPPPVDVVRALAKSVNQVATQARRVIVNIEELYPTKPARTSGGVARTDTDIKIAIGRRGPRDIQVFELGETTGTHHALIAGVTGRGKSVLLHAIITGGALKYAPDELELYLIDFKGGVEFQAYRTLPHARVLAIQSEREFGLSVLQAAYAEIGRREQLFRQHRVSSIADYRRETGLPLPRLLVVMDEFQKFFEAPDRIAANAKLLLDDIARRGRSQGVHLLLASQSLSGVDVRPSTFAQIQLRICLQLGAMDAERVFTRDNLAATQLERPGQAIYNAAGGQAGHNVEFQVVYINNKTAARLVAGLAFGNRTPLVFDGNRPAQLPEFETLCQVTHGSGTASSQGQGLVAVFGEPTVLQDGPVRTVLSRRARNHVLVCGGLQEQAVATLCVALLSVLSSAKPGSIAARLVDTVPSDSLARPMLDMIAEHPSLTVARHRKDTAHALETLAAEVEARTRRQEEGEALAGEQTIILVLPAVQNLRVLESEGYKESAAAKQLTMILSEGSEVGVHVLGAVQPLDVLRIMISNGYNAALAAFGVRLALDTPSLRKLGVTFTADSPREHFAYIHRVDEPDVLEKVRLYAPPDVEAALEQFNVPLAPSEVRT